MGGRSQEPAARHVKVISNNVHMYTNCLFGLHSRQGVKLDQISESPAQQFVARDDIRNTLTPVPGRLGLNQRDPAARSVDRSTMLDSQERA